MYNSTAARAAKRERIMAMSGMVGMSASGSSSSTSVMRERAR